MILNKLEYLGSKDNDGRMVDYWKDEYGTIFSDPIDQSDLVGGGAEQERNEMENGERINRVRTLCPGDPLILDFGCGHGMFLKDLTLHNLRAFGYDKFNPEFQGKPTPGVFDLITAIEVIEHFSTPFDEWKLMYQWLRVGGKLMLESSFADWTTLESPYTNPHAGHSTIWSHAGLTYMLKEVGFKEGEHINQNVRVYVKP